MKILNDKSGFTLIELLAVIVVLAIVAVLGYSTVLPLLANSKRNAFATEANGVIDAAQNAMTLIQIDQADNNYYKTKKEGTNTRYCFTLDGLVKLNMLKKSLENGKGETIYSGRVIVTVPEGTGGFRYQIEMQNDVYQVYSTSGTVDTSNVEEKSSATRTIGTSCSEF